MDRFRLFSSLVLLFELLRFSNLLGKLRYLSTTIGIRDMSSHDEW